MTTEPEPPADFATPEDIINAWRPLSTGEVTRAEYWIEVAARRIRRRWRDVDERIGLPPEDPRYVDPLDVRDIVVALLAALLSAVAVALAARGFAADHLDASAMLRVLGQSQRAIAGAYTTEFALIGLFASALGVALGYLVHNVFVLLLAMPLNTLRVFPSPTSSVRRSSLVEPSTASQLTICAMRRSILVKSSMVMAGASSSPPGATVSVAACD